MKPIVSLRSLRARAQYRALTEAQRASVQSLEALLRIYPLEGFKVHREYVSGGRRIVVRAIYGMHVRLEYRVAEIPEEIQVIVEDIRPTDLPSLTEYEEGEELRRSRPTWRGSGRRRKNER